MKSSEAAGALSACSVAILLLLVLQAVGAPLARSTPKQTGSQALLAPAPSAPLPVASFNLSQKMAYPVGITTDRAGNVWFAEDAVDAIVEYSPSNGSFRTFSIPTGRHIAWIWFLVFGDGGNLWFSDESQSLLWRLNPGTGEFANFTAGGAFPLALAYDSPRSRLWFTSLRTDQVGYFALSGGEARVGRVVNFSAPTPGTGVAGVAVAPNGDVFVAESFQAKILELNGSDLGVLRVWSLPTGSQPVGLALDEARGRVWFTNHASSFFGYVSLQSSGYFEYPTSTLFQQGSYTVTLPYWIQISSSGDVWFNEHFANKIARFDPSDMQLTEFAIPSNNSQPLRFALDDARGVVWFTEFQGNAIGVVDQNSTASDVAVSPPYLAFSSSGTVTATAAPQGPQPGVSTNSSIAGNPSPGFLTSVKDSGGGYAVKYTANQAKPGNYSSAICFTYPGYRECGYVLLGVRGVQYATLLVYGVYSGIAVGTAVLALALFRELRRSRRRPPLG